MYFIFGMDNAKDKPQSKYKGNLNPTSKTDVQPERIFYSISNIPKIWKLQ